MVGYMVCRGVGTWVGGAPSLGMRGLRGASKQAACSRTRPPQHVDGPTTTLREKKEKKVKKNGQ